jgi:hypothetical protein
MFRISFLTLIIILGLTVVFHVLTVGGVCPMDLVWGGRITEKNDFYIMESISISVNVLFIFIIVGRGGYLTLGLSKRFFIVGVWIIAALFILNTVGNIFSLNEMERLVFTPVTLILSVAGILLNVSKQGSFRSESTS